MSDFRFAGRWLNDRRVLRLTGDDFKSFVLAGTWMVENRTDGKITVDDFEFIPRFDRASPDRLVASGLWEVDGDGWVMADFAETQTSRAEFETLANARRREREKKARRRARDVSPGTSPGTESPGSTQDRTGQARTGKDDDASTHAREGTTEWPVAPIPADPGYCRTHGGVWPCSRQSSDCERAA